MIRKSERQGRGGRLASALAQEKTDAVVFYFPQGCRVKAVFGNMKGEKGRE
jgi:hypothetical protein